VTRYAAWCGRVPTVRLRARVLGTELGNDMHTVANETEAMIAARGLPFLPADTAHCWNLGGEFCSTADVGACSHVALLDMLRHWLVGTPLSNTTTPESRSACVRVVHQSLSADGGSQAGLRDLQQLRHESETLFGRPWRGGLVASVLGWKCVWSPGPTTT